MVSRTLDFLTRHRAERLEPITERLVDTIERDNLGYRVTGVVPRADLYRSCRDNVVRVLELLADAVEEGELAGRPDGDPAYDAARETGRRRAEQGLPLDDVLRSFRIGGRLIWDDLVEHGESTLDARAVREIGTRLWEVVDETSAQVATAYHRYGRALVRADEQQRAELWEGVLGGRAREPGFALEAARLLDVPAQADFVVAAAPDLDPLTAERALNPHASSWVRRTGGVVGLVALREDDPGEALAALEAIALAAGVPMGASSLVAGLAAADEGYAHAALALRAQGSTVGLARFDERLPEALLLSSPDVGERLVDRWLGPVLALGTSETAVLVDTLGAWVLAGGSASRAASLAHCHRNTVLNRLRRVGELTGLVLTDDAVPLELDLALRSWRMRPRPGG